MRARQVQWRVAAVVGGAGAVSAFAGASRLGRRLPADRLCRWFAYLVFAVAALVVIQTAVSPAS